jgi:Redoxin
LAWVAGRTPNSTEGGRAFALLDREYAESPKLADVFRRLDVWPTGKMDANLEGLLRRALKVNPDRLVRGEAAFNLARLLRRNSDWVRWADAAGSKLKSDEASTLLEEVIAQYGDVPHRDPLRLGYEARVELAELRRTLVGKMAPEINGDDLDGQTVKLSAWRGKVVLVSFWATWCGACTQMIPHERELVERLDDRPFVLLGVNGDTDLNAAKKAVGAHGITTRVTCIRYARSSNNT